jgi:hypothetical protein
MHGEVCVEPAGTDRHLQRADVHVKLLGQLAERQQLGPSRIIFDRDPGSQEHRRRHRAHPAVLHSKRVDADVEQSGKVALRESRVAT